MVEIIRVSGRKREVVTYDLRQRPGRAKPPEAQAAPVKLMQPVKPVAAKPQPVKLAPGCGKASRDAIQFLAVRWPPLFGADRVPLAIGVGELVKADIAGLGLSGRQIKHIAKAIGRRCNSQAYLAALAADGSMRRGLDGVPTRPVSDRDRQHARDQLAKRASDRRAKESEK
jgi:hypothetical protein